MPEHKPSPLHSPSPMFGKMDGDMQRQCAIECDSGWGEDSFQQAPTTQQCICSPPSTKSPSIGTSKVGGKRNLPGFDSHRKVFDKMLDSRISDRQKTFNRQKIDYRPPRSQSLLSDSKVQAGLLEYSPQRSFRQNIGLGNEVRSHRLFPPFGSDCQLLQMDSSSLRRLRCPISSPPLRASIQPLLDSPPCEASDCEVASMGNSTCLVRGRHPHLGAECDNLPSEYSQNNSSSQLSGVSTEERKVHFDSHPRDCLSGPEDKPEVTYCVPRYIKNWRNSPDDEENTMWETNHSEESGSSCRSHLRFGERHVVNSVSCQTSDVNRRSSFCSGLGQTSRKTEKLSSIDFNHSGWNSICCSPTPTPFKSSLDHRNRCVRFSMGGDHDKSNWEKLHFSRNISAFGETKTHHMERNCSFSLSDSMCPTFTPPTQHSPSDLRLHDDCCDMEQGDFKTSSSFGSERINQKVGTEKNFDQSCFSTREPESNSRQTFQNLDGKIRFHTPPQHSTSLSEKMELQNNGGLFCCTTQHTDKSVLVLAPRSGRCSTECLPSEMGQQERALHEPSLQTPSSSPHEDKSRKSIGLSGDPNVAVCELVASSEQDDDSLDLHQWLNLQRLPGEPPSSSKVEDRPVNCAGLTLDNVLILRDIPVYLRVHFVRDQCEDPILQQALLKELKSQASQPKYDAFFDVRPLFLEGVRLATSDVEEDVRLAALVLLRLTTFCRSADLESMIPGFILSQNLVMVRFSAKGNMSRTLAVSGWTLYALLAYLNAVKDCPCEAFFRCLDNHHKPLTVERIAKLVLLLMNRLGVDTNVFKAHSLRGASASTALSSGVAPRFVQQRGAWKSDTVFDEHYGRGHQLLDWDKMFLGQEGDLLTSSITSEIVYNPSVHFCTNTTKEVLSKKCERGGKQFLKILCASGHVLDESAQKLCCICCAKIRFEAWWKCISCENFMHFRCLGVKNSIPFKTCSTCEPREAIQFCQPQLLLKRRRKRTKDLLKKVSISADKPGIHQMSNTILPQLK